MELEDSHLDKANKQNNKRNCAMPNASLEYIVEDQFWGKEAPELFGCILGMQ